MKTDQITFHRNSYGKKKGDTSAHHINNRNGIEADMDVDFDRRVVWVAADGESYFVPFEALCMVSGSKDGAPPIVTLDTRELSSSIRDAVANALTDALGAPEKPSGKGSRK